MLNQYSHLLTHKKLRFNFGKYTIICKLGDYCNFGLEQHSNSLHTHSSYELCLILNGSGQFVTNHKTIPISAQDIIIADPYTYHEITCDYFSELSLLYIFINISHSKLITPSSTEESLILDQFLHAHAPIAKNLSSLFAYFNCLNSYCQLNIAIDLGLYDLLKHFILNALNQLTLHHASFSNPLLSEDFAETSQDTIHILPVTTLEKAQDYIDIHLHQKIHIEDIAQYCNISSRTLQYIFHKELNTSLTDYITERKIKLACHYLLNNFSIIDTANLVGFTNVAYFNKVFKKIMGLTPGQIHKLNNSRDLIGRRL